MTNPDSIQRFSKTVENYVKYRPTYPQAVVDYLRHNCALSDEAVVADVGSGTGLLAQRFLENGFRVMGVEPNDDMRQAGQQFLKDYALFSSVKGTAEATTLAEHSVDLIIVGQAFHWFEPVATRQEFVRILKPGGLVMLVWNIARGESPFMVAYQKLEETYRRRKYAGHLTDKNADDKIRAFYAPQSVIFEQFTNAQTVDYDGLKGRVLSSSFAPRSDQPEYEVLLNRIDALFRDHQQDGKVTIDYDCLAHYGQPG